MCDAYDSHALPDMLHVSLATMGVVLLSSTPLLSSLLLLLLLLLLSLIYMEMPCVYAFVCVLKRVETCKHKNIYDTAHPHTPEVLLYRMCHCCALWMLL